MPWTRLTETLARFDLGAQLDTTAADAGWRIDGADPGQPAAFDALLPADYRDFVARHGYPLLAAPSRLDYAFAFLPPLAMRQVSADISDNQASGTTTFALFAGWNLSNVDGWAFGLDPDTPAAGPVVWLVEDSLPVEVVGSFTQWLAERADDITTRLQALSPTQHAQVRTRTGDYADGPEDLMGFD